MALNPGVDSAAEHQDIYRALTSVFQEIFDDEGIVLRPDMTAADIEGWDSLAHVQLLLTIERRLGIRISAGDAARLSSIGDLVALVNAKTTTKSR